jgi:hypothetical protein
VCSRPFSRGSPTFRGELYRLLYPVFAIFSPLTVRVFSLEQEVEAMSQARLPSLARCYGLTRIARVWKISECRPR